MADNRNAKVTYGVNVYGSTVYVGRRTAAHLDYTKDRLTRIHPEAELRIIQGAFNTSVPQSAGTHDYDAALDIQIVGMDWWSAQRFLRECGWAAWYRLPPMSPHIHMVSLGYGSARVGLYIPGQVIDYYAHRDGLAYHSPDPSWHPDIIASTIFDYDVWVREADSMSAQDVKDLTKVVHDSEGRLRQLINDRAKGERQRLEALLDAVPEHEFTKERMREVLDNWAKDQR